ncbi:MAG: gamma-glutamyltransferase [Nocardioides sp.]|uniref:gamma-glutamyltransferase n=1 Tax=Nocardioides sp. TaxID=35761 RepID=UPI0039E606C4
MTTAPGRPARAGIATPHVLATDAGAAVLADGGTAVDAAIAAAAVLCVVYPNNVALGSDLVALVALPNGRLRCVNASGFDIHTSPPNTQGFALLRTLTTLPSKGGFEPDPVDLARAFLAANDARDAWLADPRQAKVDLRQLLTATPPRLEASAVVPHGDTVGISAVSADGCAVSLIQSVFHGFGACVLEPASGILFQNRGTSFSLDSSSPNVFAPGKRPRHTLMPVVVTRPDGRLAWVSSTMGGQGQPQIHSQVLLRAMAGARPAEAVAAPRFVVGRQDDGDLTSTVTVESDAPAAVRAALAADTAFVVTSVPPHDELLGHANLIALDNDGAVTAGSDPRADGSAVVLGSAG